MCSSVVLSDIEPGLVLAAVSGLSEEGKTEIEGRLMGCIQTRENGQCVSMFLDITALPHFLF